ncbi:hypothetical protein BV22DRAFT_1050982 [Leucogyrophana mollusca]|uniref:Uncharacterized protein n=1 Tax=Leucogyrophana mollusca TaxID=85980 RepID=A0ACB8B3T7_9AGAM|nr:hypothetical protein BV22DRAFT_1050982 [Leucogyrophana mollusca]
MRESSSLYLYFGLLRTPEGHGGWRLSRTRNLVCIDGTPTCVGKNRWRKRDSRRQARQSVTYVQAVMLMAVKRINKSFSTVKPERAISKFVLWFEEGVRVGGMTCVECELNLEGGGKPYPAPAGLNQALAMGAPVNYPVLLPAVLSSRPHDLVLDCFTLAPVVPTVFNAVVPPGYFRAVPWNGGPPSSKVSPG